MSPVIEDLKRTVFRTGETTPTYGGPSLSDAIADVDAATARYRIHADGHSIWEISLHAAYWRHEVAHAVSCGVVPRLPRGPEDWPSVPNDPGDSAWADDRRLLGASEEALRAALDDFPHDEWERLPEGGGDWTLGQLAIGLIAHDAYHIGQVVMLKKAASTAS